jgi:hypothetical protein
MADGLGLVEGRHVERRDRAAQDHGHDEDDQRKTAVARALKPPA